MKPKQKPNKSPRDENENENINEDENENEKGVVGEKEETPNVENNCTEGEESICEVLNELSFDNVWEMYERKGNKKTSRSRWNGLPKKAKQLAVVHIPRYVKSTPERKFRKNFETYINKEAWNDEIISDESNGNRITITENGRPLGGGYPKNGAHPFRTNAEECRNEREMLAQVAERILQKHETKDG
jgi:hypothetical protein